MSDKKKWVVSSLENSKYLGVIEFQDNKEEFHNFEIIETPEKLIFGGCTNTGFLESGYFLKDNDFSIDENLQELLVELEAYYNEGPSYVSNLIYNDRM
jgi:hypothetical protein